MSESDFSKSLSKHDVEFNFWKGLGFKPQMGPRDQIMKRNSDYLLEVFNKFNLGARGNILEIGPAILPSIPPDIFDKIYLVDPLLNQFKDNCPEFVQWIEDNKAICFEVEDYDLLPLELENSIDYIVARNSLDHVFDIDNLIDNCHRLFKAGGVFIILWVHIFDKRHEDSRGLGFGYRNEAHPYSFSEEGLLNIFRENGFEHIAHEIFDQNGAQALRGVFKKI